MAGLELLYELVSSSVSCPQDALVCFLHWEIVSSGFKCVGAGDEPVTSEKKSELLPANWNASRELYTLRYRSDDDQQSLLVKVITVDNSIIINVLNPESQQVVDLTLNMSDHVDPNNLRDFSRVFKDKGKLKNVVKMEIVSPLTGQKKKKQKTTATEKTSPTRKEAPPDRDYDYDPLRIPPRIPYTGSHPLGSDPLAPFATGGADRDPFGGGRGGMIMDPLRSGFPRSGFDPSSGIPGRLPPGAVPPGARFDPFGPVSRTRPGPDPDHLPPPGYDDMFM